MISKKRVVEHCKDLIAAKAEAHRQALNSLQESMDNETKSSAGDKYETGRAMLHIEQDNVRRQLAEAMAQQAMLNAIRTDNRTAGVVVPGSLLTTSDNYYFVGIALGKIMIDGEQIIILSAASPLGSKLLGLSVGDTFRLKNTEIKITGIE